MSTLFAGVPTIRAAIFDVIDGGDQDKQPWAFYEHDHGGLTKVPWDEDMANSERLNFVDAVIKRIEQLQNPPHDGVKLQNLCSRHIRIALPPTEVSACVHCDKERG